MSASLDQKSVIDFIVTDVQLMRESGVDYTDIGVSDHFLVLFELGRIAKCLGNRIDLLGREVLLGFESRG